MKTNKLLLLSLALITSIGAGSASNKNCKNVKAENNTTITWNGPEMHGDSNINNIMDGDESTFAWFAGEFKEGYYIQIDYQTATKFNYFSYLLSDSDYCKFKVQYKNGDTYEDITNEIDGYSGIATFNNAVTTTSLRMVSTGGRGVWLKVFEINAYYTTTVINNGFEVVSSLGGLVDNNIDTYAWFDWHYTNSCNITLDYGENIHLNNIMLLTGCYEHDTDKLGTAKFSYSLDGETFYDIEGTYNGINIYVDLSSSNIEARYIRFIPIIDGKSDCGLTVREFGANLNKFVPTLTFGDDNIFDYDGNPHAPTVSASYGVDYNITFNCEDKNIEGASEAVEAGIWAEVATVIENDIYANFAIPNWKVFTIKSPKQNPTIEILINGVKTTSTGGETYYTNNLPTFTYNVSEGADVSAYFTKDDGATNLGTEMPTTPGTYAYNVAVKENDAYNSSTSFFWFIIANAGKVDPVITADETEFYYDGNPHSPNLIAPDGVKFAETHYEQDGTRLTNAPIEPGTYALVYTTIENDTYNAYSKWVVFTIIYDGNSFLTEWHKLRADGGNDGICAFINEANGRLSKLLDRYNNLTNEQRTWVDAQIDTGDVTIGQTLTYIASIRSWINDKVNTNSSTANNLISTINTETNSQTLIVIIAIACVTLIGYFYIVEKKKKENN